MFSSSHFISLIYLLPLFHGLFGTYELEIFSSTESNLTHIDVGINNSLELTCKLNDYQVGLNVSLSWQLPKYNEKRSNAVMIKDMNSSLKLTMSQLNEKDSGVYICGAIINHNIFRNKSIVVHVRQKPCVNMFECAPSSGRCIHKRFVCDGKSDCDNGDDESPSLCGEEVCKGKIWCDSGRCIPSSWCCLPSESNCSVKVRLPCCPPLPRDDYPYPNMVNNQHYTEMNFLQSTIYTIVGFAMVFMSIVTILMICICRIHLQRSIVSSVPRRQTSTSSQPSHSTSSRVCIYNNRQGSSRMLASYSIPTNDLEIVDDICQPPPYSEVTCYSDPPPSYKDIFCNRTNEDSETSPCLSSEKPPP